MTLPLQITDEFRAAVQTLAQNLGKLPAKDQSFAASLLGGWQNHCDKGWNFSEKQAQWVVKLANAAIGNVPAAPAAVTLGDLTGLLMIFDRAGKSLKRPAIVALAPHGKEIKLSVAGPQARRPGTINVADNAAFGEGDWYGRITREGSFEPSPRITLPASLVEFLARFAADPAKVASEHGHLTGKCCFCNRKLTDERSTVVGYGETCASNYGMPYPTAKEAKAASALRCDPVAA